MTGIAQVSGTSVRGFAIVRATNINILKSGLAVWIVLLATTGLSDQPQLPVPTYPEHLDLTYYLSANSTKQLIKSPTDWQVRRQHIVHHLTRVMGPLPKPERRVPLDIRVENEFQSERFVRRKLSYQSEPGDRVAAWLFIPRGKQPESGDRKRPAVLCLQQTIQIGKDEPAGLGGNPHLHYALHLAERGYVTLAPDYPSFGEHPWDFSPEKSGYASGSMKAIWDNIRAIDLLQSLTEVDPDRIGCIGHSLGGHNALFTATYEPRIKVIVSSCGFTGFQKDDIPSWTGPRYMPRIASQFNNDVKQVPFDFTEIVAALAPRPFLACAATRDDDFDVDGVKAVLESARSVYKLFGQTERLRGYYPESSHDFPDDARDVAYRFLDEFLKPQAAKPN